MQCRLPREQSGSLQVLSGTVLGKRGKNGYEDTGGALGMASSYKIST